ARVLDVGHGNPFDPHRAQRDLAADQVLTLHVTLTGVREVRRLEIRTSAPGVAERRRDGLAREVLDRALESLAERRHADADDVDGFHDGRLYAQFGETVERGQDLVRARVGQSEQHA